MWSPEEQWEVRRCLRYLHGHLKAKQAPPLTEDDERFYLMGLSGCRLDLLKQAFRAGIGRWRWMPKPAEILDMYRELVAARPDLPVNGHRPSGCEACDGTGWVVVPGGGAVRACGCPKGQTRGRRRG